MIAYRIQGKHRGTEYLLDPETQYSWPTDYDESKVRHGVSGCETIEELTAYWATHAVGQLYRCWCVWWALSQRTPPRRGVRGGPGPA